MSEPLVSVCILSFNCEDTIEKAVKCATTQSYINKEIIVVDDASSDRSAEVLHQLKKKIPFSFIIHSENKGTGAARNTAIDSAKGEFIIFFDDDDFSCPKRIEKQLKVIAKMEDTLGTKNIACYASSQRIYPNGYFVDDLAIGSEGVTFPHGPAVALYLLANLRIKSWFYGAGTPASTLMIRKELIYNSGKFDPCLRRVEDVDLAVRLALNGCVFIGCKEMLVKRFMTDTPDKKPFENLKAEQYTAQKYKHYLSTKKLFSHAFYWPLLRYFHFTRRYIPFALILIRLLVSNPYFTIKHLLHSGPKRIIHESKMKD